MRFPENYRPLWPSEAHLAAEVFKQTVTYPRVLVSDGLGINDRPFTMPTIVPVPGFWEPAVFIYYSYVIHAGDGFKGMGHGAMPALQKNLIHELTHVWQGENENSHYWESSVYSQATMGTPGAYLYDKDKLLPWDDYNMEQQAKIVEDWFMDGRLPYDSMTGIGDNRWFYIKVNIQGEPVSDWSFTKH